MKKRFTGAKIYSDSILILLGISVAIYFLLVYYHGMIIFRGDTIETVPYAIWMSDKSLFSNDFHLQQFTSIFPNERYLISWILHWFPENIAMATRVFHAIFGIILVSGMIRLADLILKNIEMAVLGVFVVLFSLYGINVGMNELYYNMFVPSLAGKAVAVWALVVFYQKRIVLSSIILSIASFLHPLVGFQLFVLLVGINAVQLIKKEILLKELILFLTIYLATAGIWIYFLLNPFSGGQGVEATESVYSFFEIVKFRIGHHFFPKFFPVSHMLFSFSIYAIALYYFIQKKSVFSWFFIFSILGMVIYILGLNMQYELVLSSQWMKVNIWLKFLAVIGIMAFAQSIIEKKYYRILVLIGFIIALGLALKKMNPRYDKNKSTDLYTWISINSNKNDVFLVPPALNDFKAKTLRNSYFDFKAMLHHKPAIYHWAERFEEVYGLKIRERNRDENLFSKVQDSYFNVRTFNSWKELDYIILEQGIDDNKVKVIQENGFELRYEGAEYDLWGKGSD